MGHMILRKSVEGQPGDSGAILGKGTLGKLPLFLCLASVMNKLNHTGTCIRINAAAASRDCEFGANSAAVLVMIIN